MSVQIKCRILRETEAAILIEQAHPEAHGSIECWLPRSQCDHLSKGPVRPDGSRDATITLAAWLAEKHDLETED